MTPDVLAVLVDGYVRPVLDRERDTGVIVVVLLEAGTHGCKGVVEARLEGVGQVREHVQALELAPEDLVLEDVLKLDVLYGGLVVLRRQLTVRHPLDRVGKRLPQDVLARSLGEVLA